MNKRPQPLTNQIQIVNEDGTPTVYFLRWAQARQEAIAAGISEDEATALVNAAILLWSQNRSVIAGVALSGGGNLSTDITIDHDDATLVVPGTYTNPTVVVDQQGHVQAISNGSGGAGGVYMPVVDGSVPPVFITLPDGNLVYVQVA